MKKRIRVTGSRYIEDGGLYFEPADQSDTSVSSGGDALGLDVVIEVDEAKWQRWSEVQDYQDLYEAFRKSALEEIDRVAQQERQKDQDLEANIAKLKSGQYRIVPNEGGQTS